MKTLKDLLEGVGLSNVVTYLNSGNVVFESGLDVFALTQRAALPSCVGHDRYGILPMSWYDVECIRCGEARSERLFPLK